jgi:hypothetical protein
LSGREPHETINNPTRRPMTSGGGAHVGSLAAVRDFRAAMVTFLHEAREALGSNAVELRRTLEWLLEAEPARWQQEVRCSEEMVTEAKIELERCRHSKLPGGDTPSCMEERKQLERARQRLLYAEQKVDAVRKWGYAMQSEADEYRARASQLSDLVEADFVDALLLLDRVLESLDAYVASSPGGKGTAGVSAEMPSPPEYNAGKAPSATSEANDAAQAERHAADPSVKQTVTEEH